MARQAKSASSKTAERKTALSRSPTHPGTIVRDIVLPELKMSVSEAARQLGLTRQTLHAILSGRSAGSAEMALRLGRFCGNGPGLWMRIVQAYDLWEAEGRLNGELGKIPVHKTAAE